MNLEKSCGAVVFTRRNGRILYTIVEEKSGFHSFPKGHTEGNETEMDTAHREVLEETGLSLKFLENFRLQDEYHMTEKPGTHKQVTYFLAEFVNEVLVPQEGEIRKILLLPYEEAYKIFEHENNRRVLMAAHEFLTK